VAKGPVNGEPRQPDTPGQTVQFRQTERTLNRQRSVVAQHPIEWTCEELAPGKAVPASDEVVHHDPSGGQMVERLKRANNVVMKENLHPVASAHASHLVADIRLVAAVRGKTGC